MNHEGHEEDLGSPVEERRFKRRVVGRHGVGFSVCVGTILPPLRGLIGFPLLTQGLRRGL